MSHLHQVRKQYRTQGGMIHLTKRQIVTMGLKANVEVAWRINTLILNNHEPTKSRIVHNTDVPLLQRRERIFYETRDLLHGL